MKRLATLLICLICYTAVQAKDPGVRTFLILFDSQTLKSLPTNLKSIEEQFSVAFETKAYSGNSIPSLLIEVPGCTSQQCFLGEFLVKLENGQSIQLQQLAYRFFDLSENKALYQQYMALYEETLNTKKKVAKSPKGVITELNGSGH